MFKVFDLNYKEVPLPLDDLGFGIKSLDIKVGPVIYENVFAESNRMDQFFKRYPKERNVSLNIMFTAMDTEDWRLKRDLAYTFFRKLEVFYVAEQYQPHKLLKVMVDEEYEFERPIRTWGLATIKLKVLDTPFKKSLFTSQDINNEGLLFNDKWGFGTGVSSDESTWKYNFVNQDPTFYNVGDEPIKLIQHKESFVELKIKQAANYLLLSDGTRDFAYYESVANGDVLIMQGNKVTLNGKNILFDSNYEFLEVEDGINYWWTNLSAFEFKINVRFLYD